VRSRVAALPRRTRSSRWSRRTGGARCSRRPPRRSSTWRSSSGRRTPCGCASLKARVDPDGTVVANHPV